MTQIDLYDTTLRDGMQGTGISYTLKDKIEIALQLDNIGIDYIEGGFPLANEKEQAFFDAMKKQNLRNAKMVAFGSTRRPGQKASEDIHIKALLEAETPTVIVVGKTWLAHVDKVIQTSPEENLEMVFDSINTLQKEGREVFLDLEHFFDGYMDNKEYALKVLQTATQAGAANLVLCDTNGGTLPFQVESIMEELSTYELAPLGGHFHNDTGCAVANSLSAIRKGAVQLQGTINGWGERCGNANLCSIIPNITLKLPEYYTSMDQKLSQLTNLSRFVSEKANIFPDKRQPYVGVAAFSHKAGQHVDVINKAARLMEHIDSSKVGNERKILLSELAGKSTIVDKLSHYGDYTKDSPEVNKLISLLKKKEKEGYEYEAAEASFEMLILKTLGQYNSLFDLNNYHLESFKTGEGSSKTVGRIFLHSHGKQHMGAATGIGPVGTLDKCLRDALGEFYPFIKDISLIDYKVRVLNPEKDAAQGKVRVFVTSSDKHSSWDTVGVHQNIVEASWEALVDSFEYYYNKRAKV
ncbi:citramalate synthase [Spirochaeta cellobiosiphila]|uniref:citramalate synthase n=1 Tax=Spirochaeta cellobiosiphila TaxID=504483 RepID=UPI0003FE91D8|nr:citramalate synthase [Spirochaeta cellobiosiphila]